VTQTMPLQGPTRYKTHQGEKKDELWPGISTRRRDGSARRLDAAVPFALAWVYGGTQRLGAYAHETG
jgi:hypothetical protein